MTIVNNPEILFLITARGGSKRVPGKNLREINGQTLIGYKARSALKSRNCGRLIISTDNHRIADEARQCGVEVPFMRPAELASDTATSDSVVQHVIEYFETVEKCSYRAIMLLEPSTPFARAQDYDGGIDLFLNREGAALVVGMKQTEVSSVYVGELRNDGRADQIVEKFTGNQRAKRTQDLAAEYTMNGAFYLIDWASMKRTGKIYGDAENTYGYPMDRKYSVEIDNFFDLKMAEFFISSGELDQKEWQ